MSPAAMWTSTASRINAGRIHTRLDKSTTMTPVQVKRRRYGRTSPKIWRTVSQSNTLPALEDSAMVQRYPVAFGLKTSAGYVTWLRYKPHPNTLLPAALRSPAAKMAGRSSGDRLPFPTSIRVPTVARTMFRRNRSAVM